MDKESPLERHIWRTDKRERAKERVPRTISLEEHIKTAGNEPHRSTRDPGCPVAAASVSDSLLEEPGDDVEAEIEALSPAALAIIRQECIREILGMLFTRESMPLPMAIKQTVYWLALFGRERLHLGKRRGLDLTLRDFADALNGCKVSHEGVNQGIKGMEDRFSTRMGTRNVSLFRKKD